MTTEKLKDPGELLAEHLGTLRDYAKRAFLQGESLADSEAGDRSVRLRDLMDLGEAVGLTEREMIVLLFKDLLDLARQPRCGCPSCRARLEHGV